MVVVLDVVSCKDFSLEVYYLCSVNASVPISFLSLFLFIYFLLFPSVFFLFFYHIVSPGTRFFRSSISSSFLRLYLLKLRTLGYGRCSLTIDYSNVDSSSMDDSICIENDSFVASFCCLFISFSPFFLSRV